MIPDAKYLDSVGAAMADEIFRQTDDGEPKPKLRDSRKRGIAHIMRRYQAEKSQVAAQTQVLAVQETITNCA